MLEKTAIKMATNKLATTSLITGFWVLIGGVIVWKLWSKQEQLQTETSKLNMQVQNIKRQVAEIKGTNDSKSDVSLSSTLKNFFNR